MKPFSDHVSGTASMNGKQLQPVLIDTDNAFGMPVRDVDDGLALALALASPELHIAGITTCGGNCRVAEATKATLRLLEAARASGWRGDIPVSQGSDRPLIEDRTRHHELLEEYSRSRQRNFWPYDGLLVPCSCASEKVTIDPRPAWQLITDCARACQGELVVILLGSMTNLALALEHDPGIAGCIKEVVHMGGWYEPAEEGEREFVWNTPDIPEEHWRDHLRFNTWHDPHATVKVLESGIPVRFITANVTVHTALPDHLLDELRKQDTCWHTYIVKGTEPWQRWSKACRGLQGAHMHDPLAVAAVFRPEICRYVSMRVDTEGFLKTGSLFTRENGGIRALVAVDVDTAAFTALLSGRICSIEPLLK